MAGDREWSKAASVRTPAQIRAEIKALDDRKRALKIKNIQRKMDYVDKEEESGFEDFGEGIVKSLMKLNVGMQDLTGDVRPEHAAALEDWSRDAGESGYGTAGEVAGEILQLAIPGGTLIKGAKGVQKGKGLVNTMKAMAGSTAAKEAGLAGTLAGARMPEKGETRVGNAMLDAGLGVAGDLGGKLFLKTLQGAKKTKAGQEMLDAGVDVTPAQAVESDFIKGAEQAMDYIPFLSKGGVNARERALEQWNRKILNKATPPPIAKPDAQGIMQTTDPMVSELGPAGGQQLKKLMTEAYGDAWKGAGKLKRSHIDPVQRNMERNARRLGEADERALQSALDDLNKLFADGSRKGFQAADDLLRRRLNSAGDDKYDLSRALEQARADLRESLPTEVTSKLDAIDAQYPSYLTARDAIKRSAKDDGVFTPDQLTTSVNAIGKSKAEVGEAALQESAKRGRDTVGQSVSEPLPDIWRRIVRNAWSPEDEMDWLGKGIMGELPNQKKANEFVTKRLGALQESKNPLAYILRNVADPARLATTLDGN